VRTFVPRFLSLTFLLIIAAAMPVLADDKASPVPFRVLWTIEPQGIPETPATVKSGQVVASARLLPARMVRLTSALSVPEKTISLPARSTLIVLDSSKMVACTVTIPAFAQTMKPKSSLWSKQNRYFCLTDYDRDTRFEGYFWLYTHILGSLQGSAYLPPVEGDLPLVGYVDDMPESTIDPPSLYLQYAGGRRFIVLPQTPNTDVPLLASVGPGVRFDSKDLPSLFSLYGGQFEVVSLAKGQVTVKTIKPFEAQPFFVQR
jgi:hypothetical protein